MNTEMMNTKMNTEMMNTKMNTEMMNKKMNTEMMNKKMNTEMMNKKMNTEMKIFDWFNEPHEIKLETNKINSIEKKIKACNFAKGAAKESHIRFGDSNQYDKIKITKDHFTGIIGEEAVCILFKDLMGEELYNSTGTRGPDYTVYQRNENSWNKDLFYKGIGFNVKTQAISDALRDNVYGWVFQHFKGDKEKGIRPRIDPTINDPNAVTILVTLDDSYKTSWNATIYPPYQTRQLKFTEYTLKTHLKGKKLVVLRQDLPNFESSQSNIEDAWK